MSEILSKSQDTELNYLESENGKNAFFYKNTFFIQS